MASLPVVIFQFALSPYEDWQQLAWTGALLITLTVLVLSIAARMLERSKDCKMKPTTTDRQSRTAAKDRRSRICKFFYGENLALKNINLPLYANKVTALYRPVGLRQVDAAARP